MICDEVKPNCIVKTCCSSRCWEVNNAIQDNFRMSESAKEYAYGNMRKNEYCPICHSKLFTYKYMSHYRLELFLNCIYCGGHFELVKHECDWLLENVNRFDFRIQSLDRQHWTLEEIFEHMKYK
jgi:hypothetical protein